ncbi:MAG: hypothetical protein H6644_19285 [Caldilineaceae bacterium]|nr:hypothetical protein [Caldilineaceae bacterium]
MTLSPDLTMSDQPEKPAWTPDDAAGDALAAEGGSGGTTADAAPRRRPHWRCGLSLTRMWTACSQ